MAYGFVVVNQLTVTSGGGSVPPAMSGNSSGGYVASASSFYGAGNDPWKAFDQVSNTWCSNSPTYSTSTGAYTGSVSTAYTITTTPTTGVLPPAMSSNATGPYTASASSTYTTYSPYKAFDQVGGSGNVWLSSAFYSGTSYTGTQSTSATTTTGVTTGGDVTINGTLRGQRRVAWTAITPQNGATAGTVRYCIDELGYIMFKGRMAFPSTAYSVAFTLPANARPAAEIVNLVWGTDTVNSDCVIRLIVRTNGQVVAASLAASGTAGPFYYQGINLDGVRYSVD